MQEEEYEYCCFTYCPGDKEGNNYIKITKEEYDMLLPHVYELVDGLWPSSVAKFIVNDLLEREVMEIPAKPHRLILLTVCEG